MRVRKALIETPMEVLLFEVFIIDGMYQLFHGVKATPSTITALLPYWLLVVWAAMLVVGGAIGLVGRLYALWQVERAGLAVIGSAAIAYGLAIVFEGGLRGLVAASIDLSIGAAFLIRYRMLGQAVKQVTRYRAEVPE
jgi:hypothetical protein